MSWGYVHFDCCVSTGGGDATLANQLQILADIAALKVCADNIQLDVDDVQVGVDNIENAVIRPELC